MSLEDGFIYWFGRILIHNFDFRHIDGIDHKGGNDLTKMLVKLY
jgi:hypothetical protein